VRIHKIVIVVLLLSLLSSYHVGANDRVSLKTGFPTDFGIYFSAGASMCLPGGEGTGLCYETDDGWDTSFGFNSGMNMRPFRFMSFGLDLSYMNLESRFPDLDRWADLYVGPVVRFHLPIRILKVLVDLSTGASGGLVVGFLHDGKYVSEHYGPYFSALFNLDIFPIPKFGFGFEFRVSGTFYQEVCFESSTGVLCRGTDDRWAAKYYSEHNRTPENSSNFEDYEGTLINFPGDTGMAEYPWKMYAGGRLIYYF
jgi:hypothetical protein